MFLSWIVLEAAPENVAYCLYKKLIATMPQIPAELYKDN